MPAESRFARSKALRERAHRLIPGGCHTYAKGDDQFPEEAPGFIARGAGCHVWDVDGNEFIEYNMGLRAVSLGHGWRPVVDAVIAELEHGSNFTRPAPIEVELAAEMLDLLPAHDCIKFTKDGSAATSAAVKLARAATGRSLVAICSDHPFFSSEDWFIGTTPVNAGVPPETRALTLGFRYNDPDSLRQLFDAHPGKIAAVILEPAKNVEPVGGFLEKVRTLCTQAGAVLILDEMITGFRWHLSGAQTVYGVTPDLCTFGKAMANGFSVSALVGRRDLMELGGLFHDRDRVFLLSTTHGAETHALAAARATIREYRRLPVIETLYARGRRLREGIEAIVAELGIGTCFQLSGRDCCLQYDTRDRNGAPSQAFRTLFLQELIRRGVLAPTFVVSYSHSEADIDATVVAVGEALRVYARALEDGVERWLEGRPVKPVYRRRN